MSGIYKDHYGNEFHGDGREVVETGESAADYSPPATRSLSAENFAKKSFPGIAYDQGRKAPEVDHYYRFAEAYAESRLLAVREYVERELRAVNAGATYPLVDPRQPLTDIQEIVKGEK